MSDDDDTKGPRGVDIGPRNDLLAAAETMRRNLPQILEYMPIIAELKWAQFDAFVKQGFTPQQAMSLIKPGIDL